MKKTLFAALALAFVASCSNEEVVEMAQKEAITFEDAFVNNSTRSVDDKSITNANISNFAVFGFVNKSEFFGGTKVTGSGTTSTETETAKASWSYEGKQYWIPEAWYNFCAVAPHTNGGWTKTNCTVGESNTISTTLSFTNDGVKDILYAEADRVQGKTSGNTAVAFTFRHLLSKVKFSFENGYDGTGATIKVTGIKITDAHKTANVNLTKDGTNWTDHSKTLTIDFGDATDNEETETKETTAVEYAYQSTYESYNERFLIPAESKEYTVEFTVALYINGTLIDTYYHTGENAAKVTFAPAAGNSYDIKAIINPSNINDDPTVVQEPIEFTVTEVKGWASATGETTVTIPENTTNNQ